MPTSGLCRVAGVKEQPFDSRRPRGHPVPGRLQSPHAGLAWGSACCLPNPLLEVIICMHELGIQSRWCVSYPRIGITRRRACRGLRNNNHSSHQAMISPGSSSKKLTLAVALAAAFAFPVTAMASTYATRVVVRGLVRPSGIVVRGSGTLYVTELPTPGVSGGSGGLNSVREIHLGNGSVTTVTTGEPEPTQLALGKSGELYWTCNSAGVVLQRTQTGEVALFLGGLNQPSGIAVDQQGLVYYTQVPTPGVAGSGGGFNTVNVTDGENIVVLTVGEPEPTDIAVARDGTAFWTCKSAGVILKRTPDGMISLVQRDLNKPVGIALDEVRGRLYFTEVPTPGVPGSQGGSNRVSVIDLGSGGLEIVDQGDPEPTDITVAENGRVYWTCSSAGVIVEARRSN